MKVLLKRLDQWLKTKRPDYYAILFPGLKAKEIKDFEDWLGFRLAQSWKDLYGWRNGQFEANLQTEPHLMKTFQRNLEFSSLESVKDSYTELKGLLECGQFEKKNWWNNRWVPFLTSNGVDHYCVDMEGTFRGTPGQIVYFYHDTEDRAIKFPSLEAWLETFVVSLEAGMWEEQDGYFEPTDYDKWEALGKKMNRGYPKYKHAG